MEKTNEIPRNEEFLALPVERQREVLELVAALHAENPEAAKALGYNIVNSDEWASEMANRAPDIVEIDCSDDAERR